MFVSVIVDALQFLIKHSGMVSLQSLRKESDSKEDQTSEEAGSETDED